MNIPRRLFALLLSFCLALSPNFAAADGLLGKGVKLYTAGKVLKMARTATKYKHQVQTLSNFAFNPRQVTMLRDCLKTRACMTWVKNPKEFTSSVRKMVIREWEKNTGRTWPKYQQDVFKSDGSVLAKKGQNYEAHHIIPKNDGGPHAWWNMHPVPRPAHQADVHGSGSLLNQLLALGRP